MFGELINSPMVQSIPIPNPNPNPIPIPAHLIDYDSISDHVYVDACLMKTWKSCQENDESRIG